MAAEPVSELAYCLGCEAEFPDDAALIAHMRHCERHPLAADFARRRALEAAVQGWVAADLAHQAALDRRATTMDNWRAVWAAEARLYVLAGVAPPAHLANAAEQAP